MKTMIFVVLLAIALSACAPAVAVAPASATSQAPVPTAVVLAVEPADTATLPTDAATLPTEPAITPLSLVAVGNNIAFNAPEACPGCTGFVDRYATAISKATGRPVNVQNLSEHYLEIADLLRELKNDEGRRAALANADIIVVSIAHNDTAWGNTNDPCDGPTPNDIVHWEKFNPTCAAAAAELFRPKFESVFAQVVALRAGKPTIFRTINHYNDWIGTKNNDGSDLAPEVTNGSRVILDAWNAMICEAAQANSFGCADLYHEFNGPDGLTPSGDLLSENMTDPSDKGNEVIARVLADLGYDEIAGPGSTTSVPIDASQPQAAAGTATASSNPLVDTYPAKPNDLTQARVRVSQCFLDNGEFPDMDIFMNGKVPVTAGVPLYLGGNNMTRYEYLEPGVVRVAVVPKGMGIDQAILAPLDIAVDAGHRYTVVVMGQSEDANHKALVIDETAAYQKAGVTPDSSGHITINNIKGATSLDFLMDGVGEKDVPYGEFAASAHPAGNFKDSTVSVEGEILENFGDGFTWQGSDSLDCFYGNYSDIGNSWVSAGTSAHTSDLNTIEYLQGLSAEHANGGDIPSFDTFLAAIKTAGLTDLLTAGGPYLLYAPTDEAFEALPKDQLDALMADPIALSNLLRAHIVMGYYPTGTLGHAGVVRAITNLLGEQLVTPGSGRRNVINGVDLGPGDNAMLANGNRVCFIVKLIRPGAE